MPLKVSRMLLGTVWVHRTHHVCMLPLAQYAAQHSGCRMTQLRAKGAACRTTANRLGTAAAVINTQALPTGTAMGLRRQGPSAKFPLVATVQLGKTGMCVG